MDTLLLFTDGGAFDKGKGKFRAVSSFRLFNSKQELIHEEVKVIEEGTSPYAEIKAIACGLKNILDFMDASKKKDYHVLVFTDSLLCYNSLTKWIYGWMKKAKKGIYYSSSGSPVANQETIKEAFGYMTEIRKEGKVSLFHINSHTAKKNVKKLKEKFEKFNKVSLSDDAFLFIYLQNAKCDEMIKEAHDSYLQNHKPENNLMSKLKEEI